MRKKKFLIAAILCFLLFGLCGCGSKAPVITYDGSFELRLGKTKAGDVLDAGFTNLYSHINDRKIGSMSWENLYAMKGDISYGTIMPEINPLGKKHFGTALFSGSSSNMTIRTIRWARFWSMA